MAMNDRVVATAALFGCWMCAFPPFAWAQGFVIKPVAEKKVRQLPPGPLYWRVESFPALAEAQAAGGPTSLAGEVSGKAWLFTLGPRAGSARRPPRA
jgi:hypothetical protein